MKKITNYKILKQHRYTSIVSAVLCEFEESIYNDKPGLGDPKVKEFYYEVLERAKHDLEKRFPDKNFYLDDNKVAFEIEWQGATIYIGHRDLKYMIGCSIKHQQARILDMESGFITIYITD